MTETRPTCSSYWRHIDLRFLQWRWENARSQLHSFEKCVLAALQLRTDDAAEKVKRAPILWEPT